MDKKSISRPGFRDWIDNTVDPKWPLMPLTHVTKGILLEDVLRCGEVSPSDCETLGKEVSFFFYGRPAYRVSGDGSIKVEAACPTCLLFSSDLIKSADNIHAFDTGAFGKRMYKHIILDEMQVEDFSLEKDSLRPNKLINAVFRSQSAYFDANILDAIKSSIGAESWQFHAKAYLDLINSPGRNEPDDRICTIEISIKDRVRLEGQLLAIVVPHTLWNDDERAPWLTSVSQSKVEILTYAFVPGRHPEYYYAQMEGAVRSYYTQNGIL